MDFPVNRDGWSGPGRTKARWLKDTLYMPYSRAKRQTAEGEVTAIHKDGFLEVRKKPAGKTDYFVTMTRPTTETPKLAATRALLRRLKPTPKNWTVVGEHPDKPPGTLLAKYYYSGAYSMGGNGAVFYTAPIAEGDAYDRWSRQLVVDEYFDVPVPQVEVGIYLKPPGEKVKRLHAIKCVAFRASNQDLGTPGTNIDSPYPGFFFSGIQATSEWSGKVYNNSEPTLPFIVEGARTIDGYQAAVGFTTLNDDGDYVARVQVFNADGIVVQRDLAHTPNRPVQLDGLWRVAPKTYLAMVSRMFHAVYGSLYRDDVPMADRKMVYDDARVMKDIPPLGENEQRTFFMRSTDGGVTWLKLPENELLRPSNEVARWAATGTMPNGVDLRFSANVVNWSIPSGVSVVPVTDGRVLVSMLTVTEWQRDDGVSYERWRPSVSVIRGTFDIFTGQVSSQGFIFKDPGPTEVERQRQWYSFPATTRVGGVFLMPQGGVGYAVRDGYSGPNIYGQGYLLYASADGGQTFPSFHKPPMDWLSSRLPYTLGKTLCATWLNTAPTTFSAMYFGKGGWDVATTNVGKWWLTPSAFITDTEFGWNTFDRWLGRGESVQSRDCIGRIVRPYKNPTPGAPWISDHRISYA